MHSLTGRAGSIWQVDALQRTKRMLVWLGFFLNGYTFVLYFHFDLSYMMSLLIDGQGLLVEKDVSSHFVQMPCFSPKSSPPQHP